MTSASPGRWSATDLSLIGDLLGRLNALGRGAGEADPHPGDAVFDARARAGSARVERLLILAEGEALAAYRRAGLPETPGVYRRGPDDAGWTPLPDIAGSADRFDYVLTRRERGERYAGLGQIGRLERPDDPVVALAADLLDQIKTVRDRFADGGADPSGRHDLEVAFELTMTWMRLCEAVAGTPKPLPAKSPRGRGAAAKPRSPARKPRARSAPKSPEGPA